MFNLPGGPEVMVIILVALVVLGPDQLPKAMRTFGNVMSEVRKLSNGFQSEMRDAMNAADGGGAKGPAKGTATVKANGSTASTSAPALPATTAPDDVTEVIARNDAPASDHDGAAQGAPDAPGRPGPDRPSAADRAAG